MLPDNISWNLGPCLVVLITRMDEMMKGERGWRELQLLGEKVSRFGGIWEGHGHSASIPRESNESERSISSALTLTNDVKGIDEEVHFYNLPKDMVMIL